MKLQKDDIIITTYNKKVQEQYIQQGFKVIDADIEPQPDQENIEAESDYVIKRKKPVR